MVIEEK